MRLSPVILLALVIIGCSTATKEEASTDTTKVEKVNAVDSITVISFSTTSTSEPETVQNFYGLLSYALTEDSVESKIWDALAPLIKQYDTTQLNTISKNYTMPGEEETPDETLSTSTTVTVTLFYNDAHELKAVWREYNYEIGESGRFEKINSLFLFDEDLVAFYEDKEESIDMAYQRYKRGVAKSCQSVALLCQPGCQAMRL